VLKSQIIYFENLLRKAHGSALKSQSVSREFGIFFFCGVVIGGEVRVTLRLLYLGSQPLESPENPSQPRLNTNLFIRHVEIWRGFAFVSRRVAPRLPLWRVWWLEAECRVRGMCLLRKLPHGISTPYLLILILHNSYNSILNLQGILLRPSCLA
jgi:hypothetical protein